MADHSLYIRYQRLVMFFQARVRESALVSGDLKVMFSPKTWEKISRSQTAARALSEDQTMLPMRSKVDLGFQSKWELVQQFCLEYQVPKNEPQRPFLRIKLCFRPNEHELETYKRFKGRCLGENRFGEFWRSSKLSWNLQSQGQKIKVFSPEKQSQRLLKESFQDIYCFEKLLRVLEGQKSEGRAIHNFIMWS